MARSGLKTRKRQRLAVVSLTLIAVLVGGLTLIVGLGGDSLSLFLQPSDLRARAADGRLQPGTRIKLGGLVAAGSVSINAEGVHSFVITDCVADIKVRFAGLLPDLFEEGQGVVTEGVWSPGADVGQAFEADTVLAKHDENYAPPGSLPDNPDACSHPSGTTTAARGGGER